MTSVGYNVRLAVLAVHDDSSGKNTGVEIHRLLYIRRTALRSLALAAERACRRRSRGIATRGEMVVDGMVSLIGSHRDEVDAAIEHAKRRQLATDLNVDKTGEIVAIKIGSEVGRGRIILVGFDHEHTTKIGRGENGGRTLVESNVVRSIRPVGEWFGKALKISE